MHSCLWIQMVGNIEQQQHPQQQEDHQEPIFKHYCRVCKRGFGCAGALGGHMRSHAVGDVRWNHSSSHDQETAILKCKADQGGGGGGESSKHSYFLRANANKRSYTRPGIIDYSGSEMEEMNMINIKPSRAKPENYEDRPHCNASREEEDLANCLVMLSNRSFVLSDHKAEESKPKHADKGFFQCKACKKVFNSHQALGGHRASHKKVKGCYASRFNNLDGNLNLDDSDEIVEEDAIINQHDEFSIQSENSSEPIVAGIDLDFSPSITNNHSNNNNGTTLSNKRSKAHQCSICQRVFSSGQALGGHKRCHWLTSNLPDNTIIQNLQDFHFDSQHLYKKQMIPTSSDVAAAAPLDLNLPPLLNNSIDNLNMGYSTSAADLFNYEAPARMFLQLWGHEEVEKRRDHHYADSVVQHDPKNGAEEEDCSSMKKVAKLSDLKDMKLDGGSSRWLQMGIAPTADITAIP